MLEHFEFDYTDFYMKLLAASRRGFQTLKDHHAGETFYCFAFYSHGSHSFLYSAASSEEGLTHVAQHYINQYPEMYGHIPIHDMRTMLRHNIADSPLTQPGLMLPIFEEVCELTEKRSNTLHNIWSSLFDKLGANAAFQFTRPHYDQFLDTCFLVLRQLDRAGCFGSGSARDRVLLNFSMGDQSEEEYIHYASAVNPNHIVERYKSELLAATEIGKRVLRR